MLGFKRLGLRLRGVDLQPILGGFPRFQNMGTSAGVPTMRIKMYWGLCGVRQFKKIPFRVCYWMYELQLKLGRIIVPEMGISRNPKP